MTNPEGAEPPPDPLLRVPTYLMFELIRLARRRSAELYPDEPLRLPHTLALAWLAGHGPMSQRELSERLSFDPGDLVAVIDLLERHGYVERHRDARDRRRYSLHLTDAGRLALHDRRARGERMNDLLLDPLNPVEREQFRALMLKILAHHDPRFADAPIPGEIPSRPDRSMPHR
ncbi:MarR family winged helix-turn-helix transcriptional regulator [Spirillospora sp. NPDC048911]|uniref:MarR family winged helix-turn-helix transcriptional regulator n=1 Tax=Spirillospora sp. NPDC048911 TaxID=3364527 RepID=UPI0037138C79